MVGLASPSARRDAAFALLVIAFVLPSFAMPAGLPAVRAEQVALLVVLPGLLRYLRSDRHARRLDLVDAAFLAIGASFVATIALAPVLIPSVGRSPRDAWLILRVVEYWLLYRVGRAAADGASAADVTGLFGSVAVVAGVFGCLQFIGGAPFNNAVTAFWTGPDHNLAGVLENGRVVGTLGNANLFGIVTGWSALVAWFTLLGTRELPARGRRVLWVVLWLAVLGLALSQSRSAVLSTAGAAGLGTLLLLLTARPWVALVRTLGLVATAGAVAVGLSLLVVHSAGSLSGRFDPTAIGTDPSVSSRNAIVRYLFADRGPAAARAVVCDTPAGDPLPGHRPSGAVEPGAGGSADDTARRAAAISAAVRIQDAYCTTGAWPAPGAVATAPPAAGVDVTTSADGYRVTATLDQAGAPDGQALTIGSDPNLLQEPSFEGPRSGVWWMSAGAQMQQADAGLFGTAAARVTLEGTQELNQYVVYVFDRSSAYTASAWVRSADGAPHQLRLQLEAWLADGGRIPAIAVTDVTIPGNGTWTEVSARMDTPATGSIWVTRVILISDDGTSTVDVDGASLVHSPVPVSFEYLRDADPAVLPSPVPFFRQSPVIGIGPMSDTPFGSFDNDYALVLLKFGIVGLAAFVGLFAAAAYSAWRAWGRRSARPNLPALALVLAIVATAVYSVAAGVFFSYQAMAMLALWIGISSRRNEGSVSVEAA